MICDSEYRADDHSGTGVARGQLFIRLTGDACKIDIKPAQRGGQSVDQQSIVGGPAIRTDRPSTSQNTGYDVDRRLSTARCDLLMVRYDQLDRRANSDVFSLLLLACLPSGLDRQTGSAERLSTRR